MSSVHLVRHAKALRRSTWDHPDALRPLSRSGRRQAAALAGHFGGIAFGQIVSSPSVRCIQTLEPLAETLGIAIESADELVEGRSGRVALELLLTRANDGHVAACTHGDVLLDALAGLRAAGVPLCGPFECRKGSAWVLEVERGSVRSATYLQPPAVDAGRA